MWWCEGDTHTERERENERSIYVFVVFCASLTRPVSPLYAGSIAAFRELMNARKRGKRIVSHAWIKMIQPIIHKWLNTFDIHTCVQTHVHTHACVVLLPTHMQRPTSHAWTSHA